MSPEARRKPERTFCSFDRIIDAVAADSSLTERLADFHPSLARLLNRGLHPETEEHLTLADAAHIAGVEEADFLAFVNCGAGKNLKKEARPTEREPDWLMSFRRKESAGAIPQVDVRLELSAGKEPFSKVMAFVDGLTDPSAFVLDAPFDPAPLRRILSRRGYVSHAEQSGKSHWHIRFFLDGAENPVFSADGISAKVWFEGKTQHIDVRGLEAPEPMVAILCAVDDPSCGDEMIVHHFRDPIYLRPELYERGWSYEIIPGDEDEVRLHLSRAAD
ncbi:MAG: DUF2249 domain-containing protein [Rhodospirillales bacterium]|nr:DUF2249 domain-containing protein [Rhodospirillales bacterium]MCW8861567.1 DUF2249 domain-containing protein [Rhodospirillales bacterium]MCW9003334.1 DUF2249 domain-containing protein [Rhodospirillales bacterium]